MKPDRNELLVVLSRLEQAETAATGLLRLDAGPPVDALAEVLAKAIEDMRAIVQEMLRQG
jgi:hypothetical protein